MVFRNQNIIKTIIYSRYLWFFDGESCNKHPLLQILYILLWINQSSKSIGKPMHLFVLHDINNLQEMKHWNTQIRKIKRKRKETRNKNIILIIGSNIGWTLIATVFPPIFSRFYLKAEKRDCGHWLSEIHWSIKICLLSLL